MSRVRPKTLSQRQLRHLPVLTLEATDHPRPKTRPECIDGPRPCPYVGCRYHLYLDVDPDRGSVKFNFPEIEPEELEKMPATCALDVAEEGGLTLEEVSKYMNFLSRERTRQVVGALEKKLAHLLRRAGVDGPILWNKSSE